MLTDKQQRFATEYIIDLNATQSAIRAGYKESTAYSQGQRLLKNVEIQKAIQKAMNERSKRTGITADKVLKELESIAMDDVKNYLDFRTEKTVVGKDLATGNPIIGYETVVDLKDSNTIDTKNISEISIGKDGQFKFKLYCRDNALVQLGKHLKLFTDRVEADVTSQVVIIGEDKLED